jgi:hypothetical protein
VTYSALTRSYFDRADGAGVLSGPCVVRGAAGSRAQGTWVQFDLAWRLAVPAAPSGVPGVPGVPVMPALPEIEAARFLAFACPHTIAVASWVVERSVGEAVSRSLPEPVQAIARRFDVPVAKLGRLLIVEDAWARAAAALIAAASAAGGYVAGCET